MEGRNGPLRTPGPRKRREGGRWPWEAPGSRGVLPDAHAARDLCMAAILQIGIHASDGAGALVVALSGELDIAGAQAARTALEAAVAERAH